MAYRHGFSTSQYFETNHDQNWNHMHPEEAFTSSSFTENNTCFRHVDYVEVDGAQHVSLCNPFARVNGTSFSSQVVHPPHNQSDGHHTPPSNYTGKSITLDPIVDTNGRKHYKRKSPMTPTFTEAGGTSEFFCAGSSSNAPYERQNVDSQHSLWDPISMPPSYYHPFGGENTQRNVRSRSSVDIDVDVPIIPHRGTSYMIDHSSCGPTLPLFERNHVHTNAPSHGRTFFSDSGSLNQDPSHFSNGSSSTSNFPGHMGRYSNDHSSGKNAVVSQRLYPTFEQYGGAHGSYPQRSDPTNRVETGGLWYGQAAPLEEKPQNAAVESSSFRHPSAFTSNGWNSRDKSKSSFFPDNYQPFSLDDFSLDMQSRGITISSRSSFHDSRGLHMLHSQNRELSLDVDSMSYEELLALGERIGSVSTGLADDQLSKCLKETTYLSSKQVLKEERCVICLEEYKNMDEIGSLTSCDHEYHVGCIKKWLSMKNSCPICIAPALSDDLKKEKMKASVFNPSARTATTRSYMPTFSS